MKMSAPQTRTPSPEQRNASQDILNSIELLTSKVTDLMGTQQKMSKDQDQLSEYVRLLMAERNELVSARMQNDSPPSQEFKPVPEQKRLSNLEEQFAREFPPVDRREEMISSGRISRDGAKPPVLDKKKQTHFEDRDVVFNGSPTDEIFGERDDAHEDVEELNRSEHQVYMFESARKADRRQSFKDHLGESYANGNKPVAARNPKTNIPKPPGQKNMGSTQYYDPAKRLNQRARNSDGVRRVMDIKRPTMTLKAFSAEALIRFVEDVMTYEDENKQEIGFAQRLLPNQIEAIAVHFDQAPTDVRNYSDDDVMSAIEYISRPLNRADFLRKMARALSSYDWKYSTKYELQQQNYYIYHTHLKAYVNYFQQVYFLLCKYISDEKIPPVTNKDEGLITALTKHEPRGILYRIIKVKGVYACKTMETLIQLVFSQMDELFQSSVETRNVAEYFKSSTSKFKPPEDEVRKPFFQKKQPLNNVVSAYSEDDPEEDTYRDLSDNLPNDYAYSDDSDFPEPPEEGKISPIGEVSQELNEIRPPMKGKLDTASLACFKAITEGVCRKEYCTYNHEHEAVSKSAEELVSKLAGKPWTKVPGNKHREPPPPKQFTKPAFQKR